MLPDAVVEAFTLAEGREAPVVSLYVTVDEATLDAARQRDPDRARPDRRQPAPRQARGEINEATLAAGLPATLPFAAELAFLHRLARHLKAQREVVRGKPENFNRPDYTFRVDARDGAAIVGDERVEIVPRQRGSPLDLIVAEAMILANSTWGGWLARLRRARHLPQPGEPGAGRQGAHGHSGRRRTPAWAWRSTPGRPRRCAATSTS